MTRKAIKKEVAFPHVVVEWRDHYFIPDTVTMDEVRIQIKEGCVRTTAGYLIHEDRRTVAIASTVEEDGEVTEVNYLLKSDIVSRSDKAKE